MKDPHEILDEAVQHPQAREVMETALRNLIETAEGHDITQEEIAVYLCSAMGQDYYSK